MFASKSAVTALEFASQIPDIINTVKGGSLIEYTRPTRVEPNVLIDSRATTLPYIEDVLYTGLNLFCGYYLQAVSLSVNVGAVDVLRVLDRVNPKRDILGNASRLGTQISREDFKHHLPFSLEYDTGIPDTDNPTIGRVDSGGSKNLNEVVSLSVGKLIEVHVESQNQKATFPIQVRLISNIILPDILVDTMALGSKSAGSLKERYHQWRAGQIDFFKDLVLCQDLIDQHKKNSIKDTTGYYQRQRESKRGNIISAILSRTPSVATASSIIVMTSDTAKELESKIRGKLNRFNDREKLFQETYSMMLFVINPEWEQVTMYHRSIEQPTEASVKEIQSANKRKGGPNIAEILMAFKNNQPAQI